MIRLLFFGASDHSAKLLGHLVDSVDYDLLGIVTQPSDNAVVKINRELKLPIWAPAKFDPETSAQIRSRLDQPDLIIVLDYGLLIPVSLVQWPHFGSINIHYSLLPAYRGANPVPWAILDGAQKTGVSFVFLSEKFDQGDILAQKEIELVGNETAASLRQKCLQTTLQIFDDVLALSVKAKLLQIPPERAKPYQLYLPPKKQPARSPTHLARRLTREHGRINWSKPPDYLERQIRAFYPWPGVWTTLGELADHWSAVVNDAFQASGRTSKKQHLEPLLSALSSKTRVKRVKILKAHLNPSGHLQIDKLQVEGKKPISWQQFLAGYHLPAVNQP